MKDVTYNTQYGIVTLTNAITDAPIGHDLMEVTVVKIDGELVAEIPKRHYFDEDSEVGEVEAFIEPYIN